MTTPSSAKAVGNSTIQSVFMNRYVAGIVLLFGLLITAAADGTFNARRHGTASGSRF